MMSESRPQGASAEEMAEFVLDMIRQILAVDEDKFYRLRLKQGTGLSIYERRLAEFFVERLAGRRVLHAGIGFGPLIALLAANGFEVAGVERDKRRMQGAEKLMQAISQRWPLTKGHYRLFFGTYPDVIDSAWIGEDIVLLLTNVVSGWSRELEDKVIATFSKFGAVIFFARLFGHIRETAEEQGELLGRIRSMVPGRLEPLPTVPLNAAYLLLPERGSGAGAHATTTE
jgi:hypothetical protein